MRTLILLSLLCVFAAASADDNDAVNERIPVQLWQMEEHWGIDCRATWTQLQQTGSASGACESPGGISEILKLCAAIYQPPGKTVAHSCPDYNRALNAIEQEDCNALVRTLEEAEACDHGSGGLLENNPD